MHPEPLRVAFVPGVMPDKWARVWSERVPHVPLELTPVEDTEQESVLHDGRAALCFVRLPVDRERLHVIPLYEEQPVVVAPKGHFVEAADEVGVEDLSDEHLLQPPADVPEWAAVSTEVRDGTRVEVPPLTMKQAVETIAAGVGIVIVPLSVARLHHRKDVVHRPVRDVATSPVGLAWVRPEDPTAQPDPLIETFIGIVRGRRATSSRGGADLRSETKAKPPRTGASPAKRSGKPRAGGSRGTGSRGAGSRGRRGGRR